jgi:hypothetical protein
MTVRLTAMNFVPQLLTNDQKEWCVNMCLELREKANEDPTFTRISRIITGVGFMVMIQKQSNNCRSGRANNHQEEKGAAGPLCNEEHAYCFFRHEGDCSP